MIQGIAIGFVLGIICIVQILIALDARKAARKKKAIGR